ncbi:hypothetical protein [Actinorugispora endophytica]|uniref:Uncharacterized protein n=1 Tax=Actinorugispora endophytica TaxID=1605990 RepID=A0A4R6UT62_9ACTN|nr:hypothetical protein [Actinorugispora endophytica]TDQ48525.1 hypothetical protein EV190_11861 [Actinorugispora endophytica]
MSSTESPVSGAPGRRRKPAESPTEERPSRSRGSRRRRSGGRAGKRGPLVPVLIGVLALAVVALGVVLVMEFTGSGGSEAATAAPTRYEVYETGEAVELLDDREADPRPLNENEVFADSAELSSGDLVFALESQSLTDNCAEAVWGPRALAALESAECSQVARGGYVADGYIGVAAIFKLRDTEASQTLAEGLAPVEGEEAGSEGGFLVPPSTEAPFDALGAGYSSATATVNGHYLVVLWTQSEDSTSAEETENLETPLIALNGFDMPVYYRLTEREAFLENTGAATEGTTTDGTTTDGTTTDGTTTDGTTTDGTGGVVDGTADQGGIG